MEGDESCVSLVGRWICYANGWWDFKVDKTRPGKCINCGLIDTFKSLQKIIREKFRIVDPEIVVLISYWADDALVRVNGKEIPPQEIRDDWSFRVFKSLLRSDSSVNLFVTFERLVDGQLRVLEPFEIAISPLVSGSPHLQEKNRCRELIIANTVKDLQPYTFGVPHKTSVHHGVNTGVHEIVSSAIPLSPSIRGSPLLQEQNGCREIIVANTVKELQPYTVGVPPKTSVHHGVHTVVHQTLKSANGCSSHSSAQNNVDISRAVDDFHYGDIWIDDNSL